MSSLYKNTKDHAAAPAAPSSPTASKPSDLYAPKAAATIAPASQSIPLLSDEAKAEAKATALRAKDAAVLRGQQAGAAAKVAAAGLGVRLAALRQQPVSRMAKLIMGAIAGIAVIACGALEWNAHRSISAPVAAAASIAPKAAVASTTPAPAIASSTKLAPAVAVAAPIESAPVQVANKQGSVSAPLKPKSFNPMSPDYQRPTATTAPAASVVDPGAVTGDKAPSVTAAPSVSPAGKFKSFNPMSPNYKPVAKKQAQPSAWEKQNDDAIDAYAARVKAAQGH
jgi:hypothetical protein